MKKFLLALVIVALVAMPVFASVQNLKVSGSIDSSMVLRESFDFGALTTNDIKQNFFMTQTTVQVDADLTENVSTTVQLLNERAWDVIADNQSEVDINLAYVTLREMLYSPLTVIIGRQAFSYGNSLVISSSGNAAALSSGIALVAPDLSKQKAFDAIRIKLDYSPLTLEFFYAMIDEGDLVRNAGFDGTDRDLIGMDSVYKLGDKMNTEVEGYFFFEKNKATQSAGTGAKSDTIYTPGFRVSTNPIEGLNVQAEYAHQLGTYVVSQTDNRSRNANAVQLMASYVIPAFTAYKPVGNYKFTYVSGDVNGQTGNGVHDYAGWNPLYENQGYLAGYSKIYNALFTLTNLFIHEASLEVKPIEDVTATIGWSGLWLDDEYDGTAGQTMTNNYGTYSIDGSNSYVGSEADVALVYDYTEDVQIGANLGWFFPGNLYNPDNQDGAKQAIVNVNVAF